LGPTVEIVGRDILLTAAMAKLASKPAVASNFAKAMYGIKLSPIVDD
jgi:hypothetical protein